MWWSHTTAHLLRSKHFCCLHFTKLSTKYDLRYDLISWIWFIMSVTAQSIVWLVNSISSESNINLRSLCIYFILQQDFRCNLSRNCWFWKNIIKVVQILKNHVETWPKIPFFISHEDSTKFHFLFSFVFLTFSAKITISFHVSYSEHRSFPIVAKQKTK